MQGKETPLTRGPLRKHLPRPTKGRRLALTRVRQQSPVAPTSRSLPRHGGTGRVRPHGLPRGPSLPSGARQPATEDTAEEWGRGRAAWQPWEPTPTGTKQCRRSGSQDTRQTPGRGSKGQNCCGRQASRMDAQVTGTPRVRAAAAPRVKPYHHLPARPAAAKPRHCGAAGELRPAPVQPQRVQDSGRQGRGRHGRGQSSWGCRPPSLTGQAQQAGVPGPPGNHGAGGRGQAGRSSGHEERLALLRAMGLPRLPLSRRNRAATASG